MDYNDDDALIMSLIAAAEQYLRGAVGDTVSPSDERAKTIIRLSVADLYDNRQMSERAGNNARKLINSLLAQIYAENKEQQ